jgi:putative nucleotidyltransferase with HDIG domain
MFGAKNEQEFASWRPWETSPEHQPDGRASVEKAKAMIETAMREGSHFFEWTHKRSDGLEFPTDVLLNRIDQGGRVTLHATVRDISERKRGEYLLLRINRALKTLSEANAAMVRASSQEELFREMCRVTVEVGGYRMAWIGLAERDSGKAVHPVATSGHVEGYLDGATTTWADAERGQGPTGTAVRTGVVQINRDFATNARMAPWRDEALRRGYRSSIALPLIDDSHVFGVFTIYAAEPDAFGHEEVELLTALAGDISYGSTSLRIRVDREATLQRLAGSMEETIQAVASTVEMRDAYTAGHQRRVARIAEAIASEMGLTADRIHGLRLASIVHDVGKIKVPAEILSKPGKLSKFEYELIREHPRAGHDILKSVSFPWPIADIVLQHHERLDGSGYPSGLKGDAILLEARILGVADVVEAWTSHRPYRAALGLDAALTEIQRGSGMLYDPAVIEACVRIFGSGRFMLGD